MDNLLNDFKQGVPYIIRFILSNDHWQLCGNQLEAGRTSRRLLEYSGQEK